jgi:alpha-galactosidase
LISRGSTSAPEEGRARTPPMGWNDWNSFGCDITQQDVMDTADLFVSTGLRDAGYDYINVDDCWASRYRDAQGRLKADPVDFPDGIKFLADYVHKRGLKFGIYSSAGSYTCAKAQPGSLGNELIDARTFAAWGVDYLKYDNCGTQRGYPKTRAGYIARYQVMADAIAQVHDETGKSLVYSICEWGNWQPWNWAGKQSNLWRTTNDIVDNYPSMLKIFRTNVALAAYARPGAWNDPDMLQVGNGGMTDAEYRSHFSLWAMMAAPLFIGTDLRDASPATMSTFRNRDLIAVDQDPLGRQATVVSNNDGLYVLSKPLAYGDTAVALFNSRKTDRMIRTTTAAVGATGLTPGFELSDLWSKTVYETDGDISFEVPAHQVRVFRVSAAKEVWRPDRVPDLRQRVLPVQR